MFLQKLLQKLFDLLHPPALEPDTPPPSIAEIASANGNFDILVAALGTAGLTETFLNEGDFTVFAPTDQAFSRLAGDTLGLDVEDKSETEIATLLVETLTVPTLTRVLEFHVKAGSSSVAELQELGSITTLLNADGFASTFDVNGNELSDEDPEVENPEFVEGLTDIQASNGIIQVIDRVLLPLDLEEELAQPTIEDIASTNDSFEALSAALSATGLNAVVDDRDADFTVFAPTDDAFRTLATDLGLDVEGLADADIAGALVGALGADLITNVLLYHVVPGSASLSELQEARLIDTALPGAQVVIDGAELIDADPQIENPNFVLSLTDIEAANGEIQVIDRVLLPIDVEPVEDLKVIGTKMADVLQGGAGNDKAFGRAGSDVIEGGSGNDFLSGGLGSDLINGGAGDDRLRGGFGDDRLTAGAGNDLLVGGFGHDTFDFTDLAGSNKIRDFSSTDTLLLSAEDFATAGDVLETASELGRGILLETDDGSIFLRDVATLAESDILIV